MIADAESDDSDSDNEVEIDLQIHDFIRQPMYIITNKLVNLYLDPP